jgi:hypothetical protein
MGGNPGVRPLSFGEILDVALKIFGRHWRTLVACVLVPTVPIQIAGVLVVLSIAPEQFDLGAEPTTSLPEGSGSELTALFLVQVLSLLASLLAWAACFKAVADGYLGREASVAGSLRFGLPKIPRLFGLGVVCGLLIAVGLLGLVVGALFVAAFLILAVPALLFERIGVFAAIGRSFELVKGRYWPIVLMLLVIIVALIVIAVVLGGLLGGIVAASGGESEAGGAFVAFIVNVASTAVTTPIFAAIVSVLYVDQRVRREGFDPQQLAGGVGAPGASPAPGPAVQPAPSAPSGWQPPSPPTPRPGPGSPGDP